MNYGEMTLSVTQLNEYVKHLIDSDELLQTAAVSGEISNFKNHYATGHLYFSLKDDKSSIKCVMFSRDAARLRFVPENGMKVTVWGRVSVFPRDGAYQLYAGFMSPTGLGEQYAAFERLKRQLADEGLFDRTRKKAIPKYPYGIGIITSPTGAAIRDLLNILARRWPAAKVEIYPALVQGVGAPASLKAGIEYFNKHNNVDVIIIGRGGGSGEDLSAFNDEALARAIAASKIPTISAVGHETDTSISDYVADLRAPTPSAAAELAVPDMGEYSVRLSTLLGRARGIVAQRIASYENKLKTLAASSVLSSPRKYIDLKENELLYLCRRLDSSYGDKLQKASAILGTTAGKLDALSPIAVLSRGYGMIEKNGSLLASVTELETGDEIEIILNDGRASAVVNTVRSKDNKTEK